MRRLAPVNTAITVATPPMHTAHLGRMGASMLPVHTAMAMAIVIGVPTTALLLPWVWARPSSVGSRPSNTMLRDPTMLAIPTTGADEKRPFGAFFQSLQPP